MHMSAHAVTRMQRSQNNLKEQVFSLHRVHPGAQTEIVKTFPDELSYPDIHRVYLLTMQSPAKSDISQ